MEMIIFNPIEMGAAKIAGAWLVLASLGVTQDLPPEVRLLARIKSHMRGELSGLPNYTLPRNHQPFHRNAGQASLNPLDTVRLEIVSAIIRNVRLARRQEPRRGQPKPVS